VAGGRGRVGVALITARRVTISGALVTAAHNSEDLNVVTSSRRRKSPRRMRRIGRRGGRFPSASAMRRNGASDDDCCQRARVPRCGSVGDGAGLVSRRLECGLSDRFQDQPQVVRTQRMVP
jgi:hypothetical protein